MWAKKKLRIKNESREILLSIKKEPALQQVLQNKR